METEITKKIRSAIESKLVELDAFVDDELPEYIMVMVANKKTKEQMDDDLSLFLGKNVSRFTTWLLNMLQAEKGSSGKHAGKFSKAELDKDVKRPSEDEEDVLALDAQQQETDELERDLQEGGHATRKKDGLSNKQDRVNEVSVKLKPETNDRVTAKQVFETQLDDSSKNSVNIKQTKIQSKYNLKSTSSKLPDAADIEDIEYDPQNPSLNVKSVANRVPPPDRKSNFSLPHQANKLILFKAMDEANKSVLSKQKLEEVYNPTPIKVLTSNRSEPKNKYNDYRPSPISLRKLTINSEEEDEEYVPQPYATWNAPSASPPLVLDAEEELVVDEYIPETVGRTVLYDPEAVNPSSIRTMKEPFNGETKGELDAKPVSPHFVVTLDGYDSKSRKRGWSEVSHSETSDKEDIENMDTQNSESLVEMTAAKKAKSIERCRYWPLCKNGDSCEFHHPTTPCKAFPKCTYGSKCFYVHPNCKFDSLCTRKDCPFTHTSKKEFPIPKTPSLPFSRNPYPISFKAVPYSGSSPQCKFFPNCTAYKCPFYHPKPCRYGAECQSPTCTFIHPPFPPPSQLKWKAESF